MTSQLQQDIIYMKNMSSSGIIQFTLTVELI